MNATGDWRKKAPRAAGALDPAAQDAAWAVGIDTLARASAVAVTADDETGLRADMAHAITGMFADWVIVDMLGAGRSRRAVAALAGEPGLSSQLLDVPVETCPLIWSTVQRSTPALAASIDDELLLGAFPGGAPVATSLGARSVAVGPVLASGAVCGAITAVRCGSHPRLGFRELGILSQIGELTGAAADRLRKRWRVSGLTGRDGKGWRAG